MIPQYIGGDNIKILSAEAYLRLVRNPELKKRILKVRYLPAPWESDSFGSFKVTMIYESKLSKPLSATK